jgi:hypothetical protein
VTATRAQTARWLARALLALLPSSRRRAATAMSKIVIGTFGVPRAGDRT